MNAHRRYPILILLLVVNCTYHPFVPPGEIISMESPATLDKNTFSISSAYGGAGAILNYGITDSWIKLKYGLSTSGIFY